MSKPPFPYRSSVHVLGHPLSLPLRWQPVYHTLVWGGRRLSRYRRDLPADGPIGESWDLADHPRGMSRVASGPLAGTTLRELTATYGPELVGAGFPGGDFPLLIKLIDARDKLSVQVHPDDGLARSLGVGSRGKTECWLMLDDGGELWAGTNPGVDRARFAAALDADAAHPGTASASPHVAALLRRHAVRAGDFFFLRARAVHALGAGCLLYEVQQTCDVTFRASDWGRLGLDGKPRPLHRDQALATIDYDLHDAAVPATWQPHPGGGQYRALADCPYFRVREHRIPAGTQATFTSEHGLLPACSILSVLVGTGFLTTPAGATAGGSITPWQTWLIPALAGPWQASACETELRLLVAQPKYS